MKIFLQIPMLELHLESKKSTCFLAEPRTHETLRISVWSRACFHFVFGPVKLKLSAGEILVEMLTTFFSESTLVTCEISKRINTCLTNTYCICMCLPEHVKPSPV